MLIRVTAVMLSILKTVVRYINRFDKVPIAPSFSNVSFPEMFQLLINFEEIYIFKSLNIERKKRKNISH